MGLYINPTTGATVEVADADAKWLNWEPATPEHEADRAIAAQNATDYGGLEGTLEAARLGIARGLTGGASDIGLRLSSPDLADEAAKYKAANPITSTGSELGAMLLGGPKSFGGAASAIGRGVAKRIEGDVAGFGAKLIGGAVGAGTETTLYNVGAVASEAALSDDPLTVDHLKGAVTTGYLLGGPLGAASGALEHALGAGSRHLARLKTEAEAAPTVAADLATLDRKGLETVKTAEDAAIEAARVPQRAQLAADVGDLVATLKADQPWLAVGQGATLEQKRAAIKAVKPLKAAMKKAEATAADLEAQALAAETRAAMPGTDPAAAQVAAPAPRQTWKEFTSERMGEYMKSEGGHGPAMKRLGEEWKAYKAAEPVVGTSAAAVDHVALRAEATAAREAADRAAEAAIAAEQRANVMRAKAVPWMSEAASVSNQSDRVLRNLLDDPKALAGTKGHDVFVTKAKSVATALRKEETHYENILAHEGELKALYAHDTSPTRAQAFAAIPKALEKNRALQQKIDALIAVPSSPRLAAINDAITSYADRAKLTTAQKIGGAVAGGAAMSAVYAVGGAIPGVGFLAPMAGAAAAGAVIGKLGRVLGKTSVASLERSKRAVDALMSGVRSTKRIIPPLASKVLAAFASTGDEPPAPHKAAPSLQDLYERSAAHITALVTPGPMGNPVVRPIVRTAMAKRIAPIVAHDSRLADQMETGAVRRIEFLAGKMPKVTMIGATRMMPSDGAIRAWARMVAAADDPGAVEERVAHGTVTPEDREVMQTLYPERYAAFVRQVIEHPEAVGKLPYRNRLALAVYTGATIDATLEPRILGSLQSIYAREPGSEGGTQAPRPQPAFGSVKAPDETPAQRRASHAA